MESPVRDNSVEICEIAVNVEDLVVKSEGRSRVVEIGNKVVPSEEGVSKVSIECNIDSRLASQIQLSRCVARNKISNSTSTNDKDSEGQTSGIGVGIGIVVDSKGEFARVRDKRCMISSGDVICGEMESQLNKTVSRSGGEGVDGSSTCK